MGALTTLNLVASGSPASVLTFHESSPIRVVAIKTRYDDIMPPGSAGCDQRRSTRTCRVTSPPPRDVTKARRRRGADGTETNTEQFITLNSILSTRYHYHFKAVNAPNSISTGAPSQIPLGAYSAPQLYLTGPTCQGRGRGEGKRNKWETGERKMY